MSGADDCAAGCGLCKCLVAEAEHGKHWCECQATAPEGRACASQDIKPSNFLLKQPAGTQPQLEIRVVDFGCSQRIQAVCDWPCLMKQGTRLQLHCLMMRSRIWLSCFAPYITLGMP